MNPAQEVLHVCKPRVRGHAEPRSPEVLYANEKQYPLDSGFLRKILPYEPSIDLKNDKEGLKTKGTRFVNKRSKDQDEDFKGILIMISYANFQNILMDDEGRNRL